MFLSMYHLVFPRLEQFVKLVDWMGFKGFSIIFQLKRLSSSFFINKFRFDWWLKFLHNNWVSSSRFKARKYYTSKK